MQIGNIINDLLNEEIQNRRLAEFLLTKWRQENPNLSEENLEEIYNRYRQIQNNINPELPQVISFLARFDGRFGYERFPEENLKDITKFTYKQITSLLMEYTKLDDLDAVEEEQSVTFDKKNSKPTPEKIEASKDLWFGPQFRIIDEGDFRVYQIPNKEVAVRFGYYMQEMLKKLFPGTGNLPWCVTWRPDLNYGENQWGNYRGPNHKRTFYFVIDESKFNADRNDRNYAFAAIQKTPNGSGFVNTPILNDDDSGKMWSDIVKTFPKIANHKDKFVSIPFSPKEEEEISIVNLINEQPGQYEFRRMDRRYKKAYINAGLTLKEPSSWQSMDAELRGYYIVTTTAQNVMAKFRNYIFLNEIKKVPNQFNLLNNRLRNLGLDGVSFIYNHLKKTDYHLARKNIINKNIVLYQSKTGGEYGIFDALKGDWYEKNGEAFEPVFRKIKPEIMSFIDQNNNPFLVELFSKNANPDSSSFYTLFSPKITPDASAYFMSYDSFNKLVEEANKAKTGQGKEITKISDVEPELDMKEIKRGV